VSWIPLALWGGLVGLDATAFPQAMISRPIVAGSVAGLIVGAPAEGALIGVLLEFFSLATLPIGAARYPEPGTASVAAAGAYAYAAGPGSDAGLLFLAVVLGLVWERVSGASVEVVRRGAEWLAFGRDALVEVAPGRLEFRHLAAMAIDCVRGAASAVAGAALGAALLGAVRPHWGVPESWVLGTLGVAGTMMLAATVPFFGGWRERRVALALGIGCGLLLLLAR